MDIKKYILEIDNSYDYYNRYISDVNFTYAEEVYGRLKALSSKSDLHRRAWKLAQETYYNTGCTKEGAEKWARAIFWAKGHDDWKTRNVSHLLEPYTDSYHPNMWVVMGVIPEKL